MPGQQEIKKSGQVKSKSEPIISTLNVLFYCSRVAGVIPFELLTYHNKKTLNISVLGTIWCICILVNHTIQYHISISNSSFGEQNSGAANDTNTLTMIIGIFIVYMEPFMMIVDILAAIFNQKKMILCLNRMAKVDERLAKENIYMKNEIIRTISIICLIVTVVCEVGLVLFNFLQFQISDDVVLQVYWWVCSCLPIFTNSVCRLWYIVLVFTIRERFRAVNNYFEDSQEFFKHNKSKYNRIKSETPTTPELIGYLGKEIHIPKQLFKRNMAHENKPHVGFKNNKIHIIDPSPPAYSKQNDHPSPIKTISDHLPTFGDLNEFSIGNKLDKKLIEICKIHDELCEISKMVNQMFSFQILLTMAYGFMAVTAQFYFLYCGLVGQAIPILFRSAESILISTIYISYTCLKCVSIIFVSWKTTLEAQKTGIFLHKVANVVDESHFYQIINHLSLKLLNNQLIFTACGFFDLDMTTIYAITGAVTSYLIILIQFNLAAHKTRIAKAGTNGTLNATNATALN